MNQVEAGCDPLCFSLSTNGCITHNLGVAVAQNISTTHTACWAAVSRPRKASSLSPHSHRIMTVQAHRCGICAGSLVFVPCSLVRSWLSLSGPEHTRTGKCQQLQTWRDIGWNKYIFKMLPLLPTLPAASAFFSWRPGETIQLTFRTIDWCFGFFFVGGGGEGVWFFVFFPKKHKEESCFVFYLLAI